MKTIKKVLQMLFVAFGVQMSLLFVYFCTCENPAVDWFVAVLTAVIGFIFAFWVCDIDQRKDGADNDR